MAQTQYPGRRSGGTATTSAWCVALLTIVAASACDDGGKAPKPPGLDGGSDGGVPCDTDMDCADTVDCTRNFCGDAGVCDLEVDSERCDNGLFCDGVEECHALLGCLPGPLDPCNDRNTCTIDACDEDDKTCAHAERDLDADGEPDWHCPGGTDCDDRDPLRGSDTAEVCGDFSDNDCDGLTDEAGCGRPVGDVCDSALDVSAGGTFSVNSAGTSRDYDPSCGLAGGRDSVFVFTLPAPKDVSIETGLSGLATVALFDGCPGDADEIGCSLGVPGRVRARALPAGTYFVVVATQGSAAVAVSVNFADPTDAPTNESCAVPLDLGAGGTVMGSLVDTTDDLDVSCQSAGASELVYQVTTTTVRDLVVSAQSSDGFPLAVGVRTDCTAQVTEKGCSVGKPSETRIYSAPAGTYYVIVEGPVGAEVDFELTVTTEAPTSPPAGDTCDGAIALAEGVAKAGSLVGTQNDVLLSCGLAYRDAVYSFTTTTARDVFVEVVGQGAFVYAGVQSTCGDTDAELRCTNGVAPRLHLRNLAPGTYFVVVEAFAAAGFTLTYTTAAPTMPQLVVGNDDCAAALQVPPEGGLFTGSTVGVGADYGTSLCLSAAGPDVVFRLDLTETRTVSASTDGSTFDTVITLREGACTDGSEILCDDSSGPNDTSFLQSVLAPGTYHFVVDGFGSKSGSYDLEIKVTP